MTQIFAGLVAATIIIVGSLLGVLILNLRRQKRDEKMPVRYQ